MTPDFDPFLDWWRAWYYDDAPIAETAPYECVFDPEHDVGDGRAGSGREPPEDGDALTPRIAARYRDELAELGAAKKAFG